MPFHKHTINLMFGGGWMDIIKIMRYYAPWALTLKHNRRLALAWPGLYWRDPADDKSGLSYSESLQSEKTFDRGLLWIDNHPPSHPVRDGTKRNRFAKIWIVLDGTFKLFVCHLMSSFTSSFTSSALSRQRLCRLPPSPAPSCLDSLQLRIRSASTSLMRDIVILDMSPLRHLLLLSKQYTDNNDRDDCSSNGSCFIEAESPSSFYLPLKLLLRTIVDQYNILSSNYYT